MNRKNILVITSHCLLNTNAKIHPLAQAPGIHLDVLAPYLEQGAGIFQLPCPENAFLGMKRWGMTRDQYDTPAFREHCRRLLSPCVAQIRSLADNGCRIEAVIGMDKSPNCGANETCVGFSGGEICGAHTLANQKDLLKFIPEKGLFFLILDQMLKQVNLDVRFTGISE
ncbi:MAG: hypothetical protein MI747_06000 [Desulfobacterales bacterium]|nr:hypothetical protein [Desulfobacterales bacterium]